MPSFWPISSTQSVYKAAEASSRLPETKWLLSDRIPGQHTADASKQSSATANYPGHMSTIQVSRTNCEPKEIHIDSYSGDGFPGFSPVFHNIKSINSHREGTQNPTGCTANATPNINFGERDSMVCRQDNCYHEGYSIPLALLHYQALQMQTNCVLP